MKRNGKYYMHVKKSDVADKIKYLNWTQSQAGTFYNIRVAPYRGKKYNPETYVTIVLG